MNLNMTNQPYPPELENKVQRLIKAKKAYYIDGHPIMTDLEYDSLEEYVRLQDPDHPYFETVGHPPSSTWETAQHNIPMGSLDKYHTEEDILKWMLKYPDKFFTFQFKLDGLSISLDYEEGIFVRAITRGNGFEGENVSPNVQLMVNFKDSLPGFTGSVRAEIILCKEDFKRINRTLPEDDQYANPRNAAAGITRRLDGRFSKYLHLVYYDTTEPLDESKKIKRLRDEYGLETVESVTYNDPAKIISVFKSLTNIRPSLPYDIDGAVIKVNSRVIQEKEGSTRNRPKAQRAWKFEAPGGATTFIKEEWDVGRTGVVTPLGNLEPLTIDGAVIRKATLHNVAEIKRLGIGRGDLVMLVRRGDIIPKVVSVIEHKGHPIKIPTHCPSCETELENDGTTLRCPNDDCFRKNFFRTLNWIKVVEIDNFGESLANELFSIGKLNCIADIYRLERKDISEIERWADKSADKIMENIEKSKTLTPAKFLSAVGIPGISQRTSEELLKEFETIENLMQSDIDDIKKLRGFSDISAAKVIMGLFKYKNEIEYLLTFINLKDKDSGGVLAGMSFCFTGAMEHSRQYYQGLVSKYGGINKSSVTKNLTYLVCNENRGSSKSRKAEKYGIKIITEKEFLIMAPEEKITPKPKVESYSLFDD